MQTVTPSRHSHIYYLDTLRIIACFLVILTHSTMPSESSDGIYLSVLSFVGSPSSELFIALSGAILLPINYESSVFYRKRFLKLLPPVITWSIIIILIQLYTNQISLSTAIYTLIKMPLLPVTGVYWFIYVIIGLYLFAPFISPWLLNASKKDVEIFIGIWLITLLMPYLNLISPEIYNTNGNYYSTLSNFGGFLGYWILGYYLHRYPIKASLKDIRFTVCCGCLICFLTTLALFKYHNTEKLSLFLDNLQIGSALFVVIIFTIAQKLQFHLKHIEPTMAIIAKYSFGIYLIHEIVIRDFVWQFFVNSTINPIIETFIIALISITLSYIIIKIFSYLPFHKYIVGI